MNDQERITAIALITALAKQEHSLPTTIQQELQSIGKTNPLDFRKLHELASKNTLENPLKTEYFEVRRILQSQASERGKGDRPIIDSEDDSDNLEVGNRLYAIEQKGNLQLQDSLKKITQAEDSAATAKDWERTLTVTGIWGNLWPWNKPH